MKKKERKRIKKALLAIVEHGAEGLAAPTRESIEAAKLLLKKF